MYQQKSTNSKVRHRSRPRLFRNEAGFTFVEALAAAGIFSIGLLGLSLSLVQMGKARGKVAVVNAAISLEGYITEGLANPDNYPDTAADRAKLQAMDKSAMSVTIEYIDVNGTPRKKPTGAPVFTPGTQLFFTRDLAPCGASFTAGSFANEACAIMAVIDFVATAGPPVTWHAAYHITINPTAQISVGNFGAQNLPFVAGDYRFPTPDLSNKTRDQQGCNPATDVAVMGVNRDTGAVTCLKKPDPAVTCPADTIPTGFVASGGQMVLNCATTPSGGAVTRAFACTQDYAIYSIPDVEAFDSRVPVTTPPQCVFIGANSENVPPPASNNTTSVVGKLCPRPSSGVSYSHGNPCTRVDTKVNGQCCTIAGCTGSMTVFSPPNPPTQSFTYPTQDQVNCTVNNPVNPQWDASCAFPCPGSSPASWTAVVSVGANVTCNRIVPETKPATY